LSTPQLRATGFQPRHVRVAAAYPRAVLARRALPVLTVASLALAAPAGAGAARIVTWSGPQISHSRFVQPQAAPPGYYNEPPGVAARPNALKVNVYLPTGYASHPSRRYPVLFLLHGHGDAYDSW